MSDSTKNIDKYVAQFSLSEAKDIGIIIKVYDGLCRVQVERGGTSTNFEPYFIQENTIAVQNSNHTLTAVWKKI